MKIKTPLLEDLENRLNKWREKNQKYQMFWGKYCKKVIKKVQIKNCNYRIRKLFRFM